MKEKDSFSLPTYSVTNRAKRFIWIIIWILFFKFSPRMLYSWRNWLLRCFGAKIGRGCAIKSNVIIWAPWNLVCEDMVAIAAGVEIYNPKKVYLGSHVILSQGSYLCGATHDINSELFDTISMEIIISDYAWVCARATVMPGVNIGTGAVLALGGVATKSIPGWSVYGGVPAKHIGNRRCFNE